MSVPIPETPETDRWWQKLSGLSVDLGLLWRQKNFGLLFSARAISLTGSLITFVALPYQMYQITHSSWMVGLMGAAEFLPILLLALIGGAMADAFNRRRIVQISEFGSAIVMAVLSTHALLNGQDELLLFVCAGLLAGFTAIQRPSLDALIPTLVKTEELSAVSALTSLFYSVSAIAGPALGGILIASIGLSSTYILDLVSFCIALTILVRVKTPATPADTPSPSMQTVIEGLRYARERPLLLGTYLIDINAMLLATPMALFPALSKQYGGPAALGLLYASPAIGSIFMSVASGWTDRVYRHGRAIVLSVIGWGVAITALGIVDTLWLAVACLAVAGAMDGISGIFRMTIWNQSVPDELRGRLAGIEMISWSSGPLLGNAKSGGVASWIGLRGSFISGGVACVVGAIGLVWAIPKLWTYDVREDAEKPTEENASSEELVPTGTNGS